MNKHVESQRNIEDKNYRHLFVWVFPVLALILTTWLVLKHYATEGVLIKVRFDTAAGLIEGKTKVMYKGLQSGIVKRLELTDDINEVIATIEMIKEAESSLTTKAEFWHVQPKISASGISGLDTLLSGDYIAFQPDRSGYPKRNFIALDEAPPSIRNKKGLYIQLMSDSASSLMRGTSIYFRDIAIGNIEEMRLSEDDRKVVLNAYIQPKYAHLVKKNSTFWNSSGFSVEADLPKIALKANSITSIVSGGVSLSTTSKGPPALNDDSFTLYADFSSASQSTSIKLLSNISQKLRKGMQIKLNGNAVGVLDSVVMDSDLATVSTIAHLNPKIKSLLTSGAQFVCRIPEVSLTNLNNISELINGRYIELIPGGGEPINEARVISYTDYVLSHKGGLVIQLSAESLGALNSNTKIYFKEVPIGQIIDYSFDSKYQTITLSGQIDEQYAELINDSTKFYRLNAFSASADLRKGLDLKVPSLESFMKAGIGVYSEVSDSAPKNQNSFILFDSLESALPEMQIGLAEKDSIEINLISDSVHSVSVGSSVYYRKLPVGRVADLSLASDTDSVNIKVFIEKEYSHLISPSTRFWNASGVDIDASLSGLDIQYESLMSILDSGIAFDNFSDMGGQGSLADYHLYGSYTDAENQIKLITIRFEENRGLKKGSALRYKGVDIGEITKISLTDLDGDITVTASLFKEGHSLARVDSVFWIAEPRLSLAETEFLSNAVFGSHIEIEKGNGELSTELTGSLLRPKIKPDKGLNLVLIADQAGSVKRGTPIYFRGIKVGGVFRTELSETGSNINVHVNIKPDYEHLVSVDSVFWNASGIDMSFGILDGLEVNSDSLETVVVGGIAFFTPESKKQTSERKQSLKFSPFVLHQQVDQAWFN